MTTDTHSYTTRCWWNPQHARWMCGEATGVGAHLASPLAGDIDAPLVDVRDMVVVHTALLREFRLAPSAVMRVEAGAVRRAAVVDRHLGFVCDLLHHHHAGEDVLLWPKVRERVPAATQIIDDVETQHAQISTAMERVTTARARWAQDPEAENRDALATALRSLYDQLKDHLDLEERAVLPLAAVALTDAEWHAVGETAVASTPKAALPLVFGMFAYEGDPAVLRGMLMTAPALPRLLLPRIAPRVFARRATQVHGTARP